MKEDNDIIISDINYKIEYKKNKKNLVIKGVPKNPGQDIFFDITHKRELKNFLITFNSDSNMDSINNELRFYFRYVDDKNYCLFSLRGGQYIKYTVVGNGETKIFTSYIKISDNNIFQSKFNFILLCFEESTTVLIDNTIILHIEHTPEIEGKTGIQFFSPKNEEFNINMENFYITDDILTFEPIIEMPKSSTVFFMEANDFYEQNRYDLSLLYYKKGLLFGTGDDKIYNRVANLLFLVEEYNDAEKYYRDALKLNPEKIDYKINLGRTLLRLNKDKEASGYLETGIENGIKDVELFVDYATLWMKINKYDEALKYLATAESLDKNNFAVVYKTGKCLIEINKISEGKERLLNAAKMIVKNDPVKATIILKYSLDKKTDIDSLKLLIKILEENNEYREIYELIKKSQWEIEFDNDLLDSLINSEIALGLYEKALEELKKYDEKTASPKIQYLKAKVLCSTGHYEEAKEVANELLKNSGIVDISINEIVYINLLIMSNSGNCEGYKEVFTMALKDKEYYDKVLEEYGKILVDLALYDEAIKTFNEIKQNKDNNPELLYNLGIAYCETEEYLLAKEVLLKAFKNSENPQIIFTLANIMTYTLDYKEALNLLTTYYNILPQDGSVDNLIGNIYLAANKIPEAQKHYYKALGIDKENEEYALNLAESFYRLKDYENAYYITKQIAKKDKFDRAKTLHMKVKSHLYITLSCSKCTNEWDIPVNVKDAEFDNEKITDLPENAPAGLCPKCKIIYCRSCVKGVAGIDAKCLRCGTILQFDTPSLRIIGKSMIENNE